MPEGLFGPIRELSTKSLTSKGTRAAARAAHARLVAIAKAEGATLTAVWDGGAVGADLGQVTTPDGEVRRDLCSFPMEWYTAAKPPPDTVSVHSGTPEVSHPLESLALVVGHVDEFRPRGLGRTARTASRGGVRCDPSPSSSPRA